MSISGRDLASVRAGVVLAHVLRAKTDVRTADRFGNFTQRSERWADDNVHRRDVGELNFQIAHQGQRFGDGFVHLPVSGNNQLAFFVHIDSLMWSRIEKITALPVEVSATLGCATHSPSGLAVCRSMKVLR